MRTPCKAIRSLFVSSKPSKRKRSAFPVSALFPRILCTVPARIAVLRMGFPKREQLLSKTNVAQEEYFKIKVVLSPIRHHDAPRPRASGGKGCLYFLVPHETLTQNGQHRQHIVLWTPKSYSFELGTPKFINIAYMMVLRGLDIVDLS